MTTGRAPDEPRPPRDADADAAMPADLSSLSDEILVAQQRISQIDVGPVERAELARELRQAVAVGRRDPRRGRDLIARLVSRAGAREAPSG